MRAQIVVALVVALTIVAVPLYLMRRPSAQPSSAPDASASSSAAPLVSSRPVEVPAPSKPPERVKLGAPQRVRCGANARARQEGSLCDQLAFFEEALAKTLREVESCMPRVREVGSINYVMTIDFDQRKLHVFPGASGDFRGPQARRATACVKKALPQPDWDTIRHQYRHYTIAILATYNSETAAPAAGGPPKFD